MADDEVKANSASEQKEQDINEIVEPLAKERAKKEAREVAARNPSMDKSDEKIHSDKLEHIYKQGYSAILKAEQEEKEKGDRPSAPPRGR